MTRFSSDLSPVIGEIGKVLRETATRDNFELIGFVTHLTRGPQDRNGVAAVEALVDEEFRRVELEVSSEDDCATLTRAHKDRQMIHCEGELEKIKGKTYRLRNARGFRTLTPK